MKTLQKTFLFSSLLLVLALVVFPFSAAQANASTPEPTYGSAVVDGDPGEWDLTVDQFAPLYQAGMSNKPIEGYVYLRYDCSDNVMYALVKTVAGVTVLSNMGSDVHYIKIDGPGGTVVNSGSGNDGTPPDFEWVQSNGDTIGWEASFNLAMGLHTILVHTQVYNPNSGETNSTAALEGYLPIMVACYDFGDLNTAYNKTLQSDDGARHKVSGLVLGQLIDRELDGQPNTNASGDDLNNLDDEDGVLRSAEAWTPGATVHISVTVSGGSGYLVGWFDWDESRTLHKVDFGPVSQGENILPLVIPGGYTTGDAVNVRFRLYPTNPSDPQPTGDVNGGEVEDYLWLFKGTAVELAGFNARPESTISMTLILLVVILSLGILSSGAFALGYIRRRS
jgi:hypothetical protein